MAWWLWILFGLFLLVLELFLPTGFFVFLIGIGAVVTGLIVSTELAGPLWLHWLLFVAVSSALLMYVRRFMMGRADSAAKEVDRGPQGQVVVISSDIAPGGTGSAELRGSTWSVRNDGQQPLKAGDRCIVERVEGILLIVSSTSA